MWTGPKTRQSPFANIINCEKFGRVDEVSLAAATIFVEKQIVRKKTLPARPTLSPFYGL